MDYTIDKNLLQGLQGGEDAAWSIYEKHATSLLPLLLNQLQEARKMPKIFIQRASKFLYL